MRHLFKLKPQVTICLLAILLNPFLANTQVKYKVEGKLISKTSLIPIRSAAVMISKTSGVAVDSAGNFILHLPEGSQRLSFSATWYPTQDTVITVSSEKSTNFTWFITSNCSAYSKEIALKHIQEGNLRLLVFSDYNWIHQPDKSFEKKYKVQLFQVGCVIPDWYDCLFEYNKTIIEYLDNTYGKMWRNEVPNTVLGLK